MESINQQTKMLADPSGGSLSDSSDDYSPVAGAQSSRGGFAVERTSEGGWHARFMNSDPPNDPPAAPAMRAAPSAPAPQSINPADRSTGVPSKEELMEMLKDSLGTMMVKKEKQLESLIKDASSRRRPQLRRTPSAPLHEKVKLRTNMRGGVAKSLSTGQVIDHKKVGDELNKLLKEGPSGEAGAVDKPVQVDSDDDDDNELVRFMSASLSAGKSERTLRIVNEVKSVPAEETQLDENKPALYISSEGTVSPSPFSRESGSSRSPLALPLIDWEDLVKVEDIGRGQFASVNLSTWRGVEVAVKEYHSLATEESLTMAVKEAETLATLRHPCVLSFYGMVTDCPSPAQVTEYMVHGSLKSKLKELRELGLIAPSLKAKIALQAARGMDFLHSRNVIHFDLKSANLLCDLRHLNDPVVKIGDVGLSKQKLQTFVSGNMRGTLPWMAPELFPSIGEEENFAGSVMDQVDEKVDVYSFGVVLWEIWTLGADPYPDLDSTELLYGIMGKTLALDIPEGCDADWTRLMLKCMDKDPMMRPSFDHIALRLKEIDQEFSGAELSPSYIPPPALGRQPPSDTEFVSAESNHYFTCDNSFSVV